MTEASAAATDGATATETPTSVEPEGGSGDDDDDDVHPAFGKTTTGTTTTTTMMQLSSQHSSTIVTVSPSYSASDDDSAEAEFHRFASVPFRRRRRRSDDGSDDDVIRNRNYTEKLKDHSASNDDDDLFPQDNASNEGSNSSSADSRHSRKATMTTTNSRRSKSRGDNSSNSNSRDDFSNCSSHSASRRYKSRGDSNDSGNDDNNSICSGQSASSRASQSSSRSFRRRKDLKGTSSSHSRSGGGGGRSSTSSSRKLLSMEKKPGRPLKQRSMGATATARAVTTATATTAAAQQQNFHPRAILLPPPDPSSSSSASVNLLVCTANLGNAAPDAESWSAWIPRDGRLISKTQFPVRMNPPSGPPPPPPPPPNNNSIRPKTPGTPGGGRKLLAAAARDPSGSPPPSPRRRLAKKDPRQRRTRSSNLAMMTTTTTSPPGGGGQTTKPRKPARRTKSAKDLLLSSSSRAAAAEDPTTSGGGASFRRSTRRILKKTGSRDEAEERSTTADGNTNGNGGGGCDPSLETEKDKSEATRKKAPRRSKKPDKNGAEGATLDRKSKNEEDEDDDHHHDSSRAPKAGTDGYDAYLESRKDGAEATARKARRKLKKRRSKDAEEMMIAGLVDDVGGNAVETEMDGREARLEPGKDGREEAAATTRKPRRRLKKRNPKKDAADERTADGGNDHSGSGASEKDAYETYLRSKTDGKEAAPRRSRRTLKERRSIGAVGTGAVDGGDDDRDASSGVPEESEKDGYEAYLESLEDPYTFDLTSPNATTTVWKREPPRKRSPRKDPSSYGDRGDGERKGASPKHQPSTPGPATKAVVTRYREGQQLPPSISPMSSDKPKLRGPKKGGDGRQLPKRSRSGASQDLKPPSLSSSSSKGRRKSPGAIRASREPRDPRDTPEKPRRVLRSKSSTLAELVSSVTSGSALRGAKKLTRSNSSNLADNDAALGSPKATVTRKNPSRNKSWRLSDISSRSTSGKGVSGKGDLKDANDLNSVPPCRRIKEAEISTDGWDYFDVRYPEQSYYGGKSGKEFGCYDIIVIGMQEATFSTSEQNKKRKAAALVVAASSASVKSDGDEDDNDSRSDSDNDDSQGGFTTDDTTSDDGSLISALLDDDKSLRAAEDDHITKALLEEIAASTRSKKKSKRFRNPLKKISKATSKTAKTVNTFAGGGKDHTERPIPAVSPPSLIAPDGDGGAITGTIETVSSAETTDDEDLLSVDGGDVFVGGGGKFKKWTDTDVIHHGIESTQLQGYTRALSYQFGQMRLLVYYKAGTATSSEVLKSLDVLSVSYQATGKAGLANKGGIVAEVAVNKTTKLSFLTAHLEAHEGIKHYNNRNASLQDIIAETRGSKYFDASQSSHFTFAMGDLNYRTKLADVAVGSDRHIQFSHALVERRDWRTLNQYDELRKSLNKQSCLAGFQTAYCNFPPTFKVGRQPGCSYNPKRSPSYTDRVLFKAADKLDSATKLLLYEPVVGFNTSDHKPIRSGFSIRLNKEVRWKSTAELLLADDEDMFMSVNNFGAIVPETTKGTIDGDRETMHLFITNIECLIDPESYDHLRKQEKADLPNPKLLFITNPAEAVLQVKDPSKKRRFGIGSSGGKGKDGFSSGTAQGDAVPSKKLPSTPVSKDTMRPIWKDDHVYFALQTHTEHGRPIDLSGSQLHLSLVDSKTGGSVIGSHCLNLAHLVIRSREKASAAAVAPSTLSRSKSSPVQLSQQQQQQQLQLHASPPSQQMRMKRVGSKRGMLGGQRAAAQKRPGGGGSKERFSHRHGDVGTVSSDHTGGSGGGGGASRTGKPLKRSAAGGGGGPSQGGYQMLPKPSPALRSLVTRFDHHQDAESNLPEPVRRVAKSIQHVENGSSKIFDSILADLDKSFGDSLSAIAKNHKKSKKNQGSGSSSSADEIGLRSLRLHETLIEGGLITGHIKFDVDVWWT